jgi:CxxC motif-containing protein (DUF1111 family)
MNRVSLSLTLRAAILVVCIGSATSAREREDRSGGDTTVFDEGPQAYGRALANLDPSRWSALRAGKERFVGEWAQRGAAADATTCADCHFRDGRGPRPDAALRDLSLLLRLGRGSGGVDPTYGSQLRRIGHGGPAPGRFTVWWHDVSGRYPSGERYMLRRPAVRVDHLRHGPLDPSTRLSLRAPPAVFGLGLLEAVPDRLITALADPLDADGDGISGRVNHVREGSAGPLLLGRFGWKAGQPSLAAQSATALREDLGVSGNRADVDALVDYLRALAVPARRRTTDAVAREGEAIFGRIGCGTCHRPQLVTGQMHGWPELSAQTIRPYTDLLLHDMGPDLADEVAEGSAAGGEWRTPPLWGLGLIPVVTAARPRRPAAASCTWRARNVTP